MMADEAQAAKYLYGPNGVPYRHRYYAVLEENNQKVSWIDQS